MHGIHRICTMIRRRCLTCTIKSVMIYLLFVIVLIFLTSLSLNKTKTLTFIQFMKPVKNMHTENTIKLQTKNRSVLFSESVSGKSESTAALIETHTINLYSGISGTIEHNVSNMLIKETRKQNSNFDMPHNKTRFGEVQSSHNDYHNETSPVKSALKHILLWTSYYIDPYYGLGEYGQDGFVKNKCPVNTCTVTNDKSKLKTVDSVVVHMRNHDLNPLPQRQNTKQIFVFYLFEAPPASFWNDRVSVPDADKGSFNLSITYRYDSDIIQPGSGTPIIINETPKPYVPRIPLKGRSGTIIWMSSHCTTPGMREKYIKALAKYIHVDVYGKCGWLNCTVNEPCNADFDKEYKFYISAENAVCQDYVTEKISNALNKEIIPIVYGGLDYEQRMPPHSHIDITKFESPEKLAQYLKELIANESEYWKYFEWKMKYRRIGASKESLMCALCEKLHDPNYHKVYPDIVKWWKGDSCNTNFMDKMISRGSV